MFHGFAVLSDLERVLQHSVGSQSEKSIGVDLVYATDNTSTWPAAGHARCHKPSLGLIETALVSLQPPSLHIFIQCVFCQNTTMTVCPYVAPYPRHPRRPNFRDHNRTHPKNILFPTTSSYTTPGYPHLTLNQETHGLEKSRFKNP